MLPFLAVQSGRERARGKSPISGQSDKPLSSWSFKWQLSRIGALLEFSNMVQC